MARNPRQPGWEELELMSNRSNSAKSSVELPQFTFWVSASQRGQAPVMKQSRLLREERRSDDVRRSKDKKIKGGEEGGVADDA